MKKLGHLPPLHDGAGWRSIFADDYDLDPIANDLMVDLFDHWVGRDTRIVNGAVQRLTNEAERILRQFLGRNMRDLGDEAIDAARFRMNRALAEPETPDGKAIREHFESMIASRGKDARRAERRKTWREVPPPADWNDEAADIASTGDEEEAIIQWIDLVRFLEGVEDETLRRIVTLRYFRFTFEEIAEKVFPARDAGKAKHSVRKAVQAFLEWLRNQDRKDGDE